MSGPADPAGDALLRAISERRTPARFDPDRPLDDAVLARILGAAGCAPSPHDLQPWRFLIVRDAANRKRLRACAFGEARLTEAPAAVVVLGDVQPHRTFLARILERAVAAGALTAEQALRAASEVPRFMDRRADPSAWSARWAMVAASTLVLAAEALGVASALVDRVDEERLREAFGIPDDHAVACLVALGYPAGPFPGPSPGRLELEDLVWSEHFGRPPEIAPDPTHPGGSEDLSCR